MKENLGSSPEIAETILQGMGYQFSASSDEMILHRASKTLFEVCFELMLGQVELDRIITIVEFANKRFGLTDSEAIKLWEEFTHSKRNVWCQKECQKFIEKKCENRSLRQFRAPQETRRHSPKMMTVGSQQVPVTSIDSAEDVQNRPLGTKQVGIDMSQEGNDSWMYAVNNGDNNKADKKVNRSSAVETNYERSFEAASSDINQLQERHQSTLYTEKSAMGYEGDQATRNKKLKSETMSNERSSISDKKYDIGADNTDRQRRKRNDDMSIVYKPPTGDPSPYSSLSYNNATNVNSKKQRSIDRELRGYDAGKNQVNERQSFQSYKDGEPQRGHLPPGIYTTQLDNKLLGDLPQKGHEMQRRIDRELRGYDAGKNQVNERQSFQSYKDGEPQRGHLPPGIYTAQLDNKLLGDLPQKGHEMQRSIDRELRGYDAGKNQVNERQSFQSYKDGEPKRGHLPPGIYTAQLDNKLLGDLPQKGHEMQRSIDRELRGYDAGKNQVNERQSFQSYKDGEPKRGHLPPEIYTTQLNNKLLGDLPQKGFASSSSQVQRCFESDDVNIDDEDYIMVENHHSDGKYERKSEENSKKSSPVSLENLGQKMSYENVKSYRQDGGYERRFEGLSKRISHVSQGVLDPKMMYESVRSYELPQSLDQEDVNDIKMAANGKNRYPSFELKRTPSDPHLLLQESQQRDRERMQQQCQQEMIKAQQQRASGERQDRPARREPSFETSDAFHYNTHLPSLYERHDSGNDLTKQALEREMENAM